MKGGERMEMINMLLNQSIPTTYPDRNPNETRVHGQNGESFFQQLLSNKWVSNVGITSGKDGASEDGLAVEEEQILEEILVNIQLNDSDLVNITELSAKLNELPFDQVKELYSLLVGDKELADEISEEEVNRNIVSLIQNLIDDQNKIGIPSWPILPEEFRHNEQSDHHSVSFLVNPSLEIVQQSEEATNRQFGELFKQVELLIAGVTDDQDLIRISPKILELLEKWVALANKYSTETNHSYTLPTESTSENKAQTMWKELLNTFQKRNELATNQHYQTNAKVTSKDIGKWMQGILSEQFTIEENRGIQSINLSNQPLSKIEQYVIYLNQSGTNHSIDKQLIDQFQQVIGTSRFLSLNNGVNQLSIAIRPDNLGEMMVRFTEINGEMTLKIIVSSQATRQILESNIHQLKNMFSPHQVVIEEREVMIENVNSQPEEQQFEDEENQSHHSNQDESKNADQEFETEFHDLLMNAKV